MKETLYLIGGNGFIGKNLVQYLYTSYSIVVFDKCIDTVFFSDYPEVQTVTMDLAKDKISDNYQTPSYLINLASIVTAERNLSLFDELISTNLKVLLNLFERFKDDDTLKLFIQFGSSEEYGNEHSPFLEDMRESPNSPYALIKQLTTNTAIMLYNNYGFPTTVVRPGNLYGKYQNNQKFIPYIISQLKANAPINVTPCEQKRDFISAKDFAWCIKQLLNHYQDCIGQIINLSSGQSIPLKYIIETCKQIIHSSSTINYGAIPYRNNEIMDLKCSMNKFTAITHQEVNFNFEDSIKDYIS